MSILFLLDKKPPLYRAARPESDRETRERFLMAPPFSGTLIRSRNLSDAMLPP